VEKTETSEETRQSQGSYKWSRHICSVVMLALRAWRSSLSVATPTILTARYSVIFGVDTPVHNLLADLNKHPEINNHPPTPGENAYEAPSPPNPVSRNQLSHFALSRPKYRLHCKSTRNNTIVTFTEPTGHTISWFSGGSCGFKKVHRSGYEAGYQCAIRIFKKIEETAKVAKVVPFEIELFFKGFGQGRDALYRALLTSEGNNVRPLVALITDRTPIKIGGTRAKKMRRL
jgi:small subunit ribosomal protein S11